jgi:glycosyltransferase involved in cell wall biosynthesis
LVESPDCYGWIAGWPRLSAPLVLRAHGSLTYYAHELQQHVDPVGHRLEAWAYRRADAWVAVSRHTAEQTATLFNLRPSPTAVLYNPIDVPDKVPPMDQRQRDHVVFTGTLTRKKGVVPLIDAWPAIKQRSPRAELHMYGKDGGCGEGGETMESFLVRRLPVELQNSVKFHGHVPRTKLISALSMARVAVFPSFVEAFAIAPLEAMACGCPTIYSKRGSGPEVIQHGRNGLLVDPDQPSEIADRIVEVLTDDTLARQLGDKGREHVRQNLTLENLLKKNEAFFRAVISSFHARSQRRVARWDRARCQQGN